jgi:hypothetical protein
MLNALARLVLVALLLAAARQAAAHSWYPWESCSDNDCAPIPLAEALVERDGGFMLIDGHHITYDRLRPSPDGKWHLCESKDKPNPADRRIICVYAPQGGV